MPMVFSELNDKRKSLWGFLRHGCIMVASFFLHRPSMDWSWGMECAEAMRRRRIRWEKWKVERNPRGEVRLTFLGRKLKGSQIRILS